MKHPFSTLRKSLIVAFLLSLCSGWSWSIAHKGEPQDQTHRSITPEPRLKSFSWMSLAEWYRTHADDVELAEKGEASILFVGDSIIQGWESAGAKYWKQHFLPLGAADLGIGGDMTQNLLWRLENGAVGNLSPNKVICLIGTNNFGHMEASAEQISEGILKVVTQLLKNFPNADLLVYGVFPFNECPDHPDRQKIKRVNQNIQQLETWERVSYLDIGHLFLDKSGKVREDLMPDYLHPNETGYQIWTESILEWLNGFDS